MSTQTARKPASSPSLGETLSETLEGRIDETRRLVRKVDISLSILTILSIVSGGLLSAVLADHWLFADGLSPGLRLAVFCGLLLSVAFYTYRRIVPLFLYPINPVYAASILEASGSSMKNSIVNWILLRRERLQRSGNSGKLSERMFDAVTRTAASDIVAIPSERALDLRGIARWGIVLTLLFLFFIVYAVLSPKNPMTSIARIMLPLSGIRTPQAVRFHDVRPGDTVALQGERLTVSAELSGRISGREPVYVFFSTDDGQAVRQAVPMTLPEGKTRYEAPFPPGKQGFVSGVDYWIQQGESRSEKYRIDVRPTASLEVASLTYRYPAYTGLEEEIVENSGDIRAVEGTEIDIVVRSTLPLQRIDIVYDDDPSRTVAMKITGQTKAVATVTLRHEPESLTPTTVRNYSFRATDTDGFESRRSGVFRMEILPDRPPVVQWSDTDQSLKEADNLEVPLNASMDLPIQAEDPDFGLRYLRFHVESGNKLIRPVELLESPATGPTEHTGPVKAKVVFSPVTSRLAERDTAVIWGEAVDTKFPEPNRATTRKITILVKAPEKRQEPSKDQQSTKEQGKKENPNGKEDKEKNEEQAENEKEDGEQTDGMEADKQDEETGRSEKTADRNGDDVKKPESEDGGKENGESDDPDDPFEEFLNEKKNGNSSDDGGNKEQDGGKRNSGQEESREGAKNDAQKQDGGGAQDGKDGNDQNAAEQGESGNDRSKNDGQSKDRGESGNEGQSESREKGQNGGSGDDKKQSIDPDSNPGDAFEKIVEQMKKEKKLPRDEEPTDPKQSDDPSGDDRQDKSKEQEEKDRNNQEKAPPDQQERKQEKNKNCPNKDCPGECESCGGGSKDGSKDGDGKDGDGGKGKSDGSKGDAPKGKQDSSNSESGQSGGEAGTDKTKKESNREGSPEGGSKDDPGSSPEKQGDGPSGSQDDRQEQGGGKEKSPGKSSGDDSASGGAGKGDKNSDPSKQKGDNRNADAQDVPVDPNDTAPRERDRTFDPNSKDRRSQGGDSTDPKKSEETAKDVPQNTVSSGDEGKGEETRQQGQSDRMQSAQTGKQGEQGESGVEQEGGSQGTGEKMTDEEGGESGESSQTKPGPPGTDSTDSSDAASAENGAQDGDSPNAGPSGQPSEQGSRPGQGDSSSKPGQASNHGGGGSASPSTIHTPKKEANLDYTEKVTNLVLEYLEDQLKDKPSQELLDNLGWTEEELRNFHRKWKEMSEQSQSSRTEIENNEAWREALKSLGLRPSQDRQEQRTRTGIKDEGTAAEAQRYDPPKALQKRFQRYTEGTGSGEKK